MVLYRKSELLLASENRFEKKALIITGIINAFKTSMQYFHFNQILIFQT